MILLLAWPALSATRVLLNVTEYTDIISQVPANYRRYWEWFFAVSKIPRQSYDHAYAVPQVNKWLSEMGIPSSAISIDEGPNLIARIPATKGYESKDSVCLQGHLDVALHYTAESLPYKVVLKNDWFTATQSLLGADDGIAVAWLLLTAEQRDSFNHGPIELLFTSDEEVGLLGMRFLPGPGNLTHGLRSKIILNMDSFDSDKVTISCAGSIRFYLRKTVADIQQPSSDESLISFNITNMIGGHSGFNMINGRPIPQDWIARILLHITQEFSNVSVQSFHAGDAFNVLPVNGFCTLVVPKQNSTIIVERIKSLFSELKSQYQPMGLDQATLSVGIGEANGGSSLSPSATVTFIDSLISMFHGILLFIDNSIYTSENFARCDFDSSTALQEFYVFPRTHLLGHLEYLKQRMASFSRVFGFESPHINASSLPWVGNFSGKAASTFRKSYKAHNGKDITANVFHAGVEAAMFQTQGYADVDIINIGCDIKNAHTIGESVRNSTANTQSDVLRTFLQLIADPNLALPSIEAATTSGTYERVFAGIIGGVIGSALIGIIWSGVEIHRKKTTVVKDLSLQTLLNE